jgi:hypothetical protein
MKKIFTLLFAFGMAGITYSQNFRLSFSEVSAAGPLDEFEIVGYNFVKNIEGDSAFTWKRITNDLDAAWESAICDNISCWSVETSRNTFYIREGDSSILDAHFYIYNTNGEGIVQLAVWAGADSSNADTVTYRAGTWAANFKKILAEKKFNVYPNPAKDRLTLEFEAVVPVKVEIYDVLGKNMAVYEHQGSNSSIDVSFLPNGLYIVKVYENGKAYSRTFKKAQ